MAIQDIALGTAPTGAGGDTFRSAATKINENFSNPAHAASRFVGTAAGNVMEVGAFGVGRTLDQGLSLSNPSLLDKSGITGSSSGAQAVGANIDAGASVITVSFGVGVDNAWWIGAHNQLILSKGRLFVRGAASPTTYANAYQVLSQINTTVDGNGFVKAASPVIKLFADKIELNEDALEQEPLFEKVDMGHYLIKNTEGFSDDGWYIEMPKDANGNVLVVVQYQQLEDNTIEVKTFVKKFDEETGDIVPNLEKPRDIPSGRWIDIRLKALPQPEIEISNTPLEFQPTNLAQAVAEALKNGSE